MPSYDVTYIVERKISVWIPDGTSHATMKLLAEDHIALDTYKGEKSKVLSIEPTPGMPTE